MTALPMQPIAVSIVAGSWDTSKTTLINGAFEAAYASEKIDFDQERVSFRIHLHSETGVESIAERGALFWAGRVLERAGLHTQEIGYPASLRVEIVNEGTSLRWQLTHGGQTHTRHAFCDLTGYVQSSSRRIGAES